MWLIGFHERGLVMRGLSRLTQHDESCTQAKLHNPTAIHKEHLLTPCVLNLPACPRRKLRRRRNAVKRSATALEEAHQTP